MMSRSAAIVLLLMLTPQAADEKKAADRAVAYLLKTQEPDGTWKAGYYDESKGLPYRGQRVLPTSLAGLALMGPPDRAAAVKKAADYVIEQVSGRKWRNLPNSTWMLSPAAVFLARLHRADGDERTRKALQDIVVAFDQSLMPTGGWGHAAEDSSSPDYIDLASSHNWVALALTEIRAAGIEVPEKLANVAVDYYAKAQNPDGSLGYEVKNRNRENDSFGVLCIGRSWASLPGLLRLAPKADVTKRAVDYARKHPEGAAVHHTPWMNLLAASWGAEELGKPDKAKFDQVNRRRILEQQAADGRARPWWAGTQQSDNIGRLKAMGDIEDKIGPTHTTACFVLCLRPSGFRDPVKPPKTPTK